MEFCIIYKYLLYPFVPLQWRHNERDGFLNHRCLDCLLNRLFIHSSWIFLILKQLQNSVHESLIAGNSSLFTFMACNERTLKHSQIQLNNTISHTQIRHRASQCVTMIETPCATRTTEGINNCLRDSLLSQSRWQCFIHGNIDCLCRHSVQTLFSLTILWEGSPVAGSSPHKGQVIQSDYNFFVVILNKLLNKRSGCIWIFMGFIDYLISPPIFFFQLI